MKTAAKHEEVDMDNEYLKAESSRTASDIKAMNRSEFNRRAEKGLEIVLNELQIMRFVELNKSIIFMGHGMSNDRIEVSPVQYLYASMRYITPEFLVAVVLDQDNGRFINMPQDLVLEIASFVGCVTYHSARAFLFNKNGTGSGTGYRELKRKDVKRIKDRPCLCAYLQKVVTKWARLLPN
jgi:hypothetical protein